MHALFRISEVWHDPAPPVKRSAFLISAVLLLEVSAWTARPALSVHPLLLMGAVRSADAAILLLWGPWSFRRAGTPSAALQSLLLAVGASAAGIAGLLVWSRLLHLPLIGLPRPANLHPSGWALLFFTTTIASPVAEELVFRGLLFRSLRSRFSFLLSTLLVSGGFALLHLPFGRQFWVPLIGSFVFCAGYEKEKTILAPVLLHAFGNGILFSSPFWL